MQWPLVSVGEEKFRQAIRSFLREVNSSDAAQAVTDSAVQRLRAAGTPQVRGVYPKGVGDGLRIFP